jgi:probable F420-dependent oxidoreductase
MSRIQFGVNVSGADPVGLAKSAEALGFDFVSAADHPASASSPHEVWTLLTWIAASTSRIKVATRVLGVPYRAPAMVAKMAETLDRLSGGRLILGLGGGHSDDEFRAFGLGVPSPAQKVTGMDEAIRIIRGLWQQPRLTFTGQRYQVDDALLEPKPTHRIPIWLGTYGPRALRVTGELADGWIPSLGFAPPDQVPALRDRIHAAAVAAGREPDEITLAYNVGVHVGAEPRPGVVSGPPQAVVEQLHGFAELGFTAFNLMPAGPDVSEQLHLLGRHVLPELERAA